MRKFKVDENDPTTYVISMLDGLKYTRITYKHTRKYGMELSEYKKKFGLSSTDLIADNMKNVFGFTLEKSIDLYGGDEGKRRWKEYCDKQAYSNTFEYKKQKHGFTETQFKQYNLNRATTYDNLVKRYGEELGSSKWKEYCKRQSYVGCSLDYFIEKYGEIDGVTMYENVCKSKAINLENFIKKYGKIDGEKRYYSWLQDRTPYFSKISQELFDKLNHFFQNNNVYFASKEPFGEYFIYDNETSRPYFYDYVDTTLKKCIEFNGDDFHGNPVKYSANDTPNFYDRNLTCDEIWKFDQYKISCLKKLRNIDTMVVWESDYKKDSEDVFNKCINFLTND